MDKATILIPDISGFTEFLSQTEIEHSTHIINELLEIIIAENQLDFFLSEIEGDAVLFYRKGESPGIEALIEQCLHMFKAFHRQLKVIARDTVCQCGACQMTHNLNLKFIIHAGELFEYKINRFVKASGIDMIIAHRLLKNQVPGDEYILMSGSLTGGKEVLISTEALDWQSAADQYPSIGSVPYHYTALSSIREAIPEPPERDNPALEQIRPDDRTLSIEVNAPMRHVYQTLVNVEKRVLWVNGMKKVDWQPTNERLGTKHVCFTNGLRLEHTIIKTEFKPEEIRYYEKVKFLELLTEVMNLYQVKRLGEERSEISLTIKMQKSYLIPRFIFNTMVKGIKSDLENLKTLCENELQQATRLSAVK